MISIRQQKWSAPRGAVRTHRFSGGLAPSRRAQAAQRVVQQRGARSGRRPRSARAARRGASISWNGSARRVRRHQHGLVVDRDDPLAPADLLLHEVGEQVAAHRAHGVGAEALALAGDRGGHEVQRVELRVRVRQRGAGLVALVDDQVHGRRASGVGAHALAPRRPPRARPARRAGRRATSTGSGALTITSCAPAAGCAVNRSGLASRSGAGASRGRAPGRGSGRRARSSPACRAAPPSGRTA